jgi:hypothetical protein
MTEELDTDKKHIGLIAQETKAVMDESVGDLKDEVNGVYGLDKSGLSPFLSKPSKNNKPSSPNCKPM